MLTALLWFASFLFVFSIVVVIHELGHFSVARACGVRVESFSIGFGQTIASWTDKSGVTWRVGAFPLGGYVKFFGDAGAASNPDRSRLEQMREAIETEHGPEALKACFHFKPVWQRAAVVAAGPAANFVLAIAIFAAFFLALGERHYLPQVGEVIAGDPAEAAGFEAGDLIVSADGRRINFFSDVQEFVMLRGGDEVVFTVDRDGQAVDLPTVLGRIDREDAFGKTVALGYLGVRPVVSPDNEVTVRHGPFGALARGAERTWAVTEGTGRFVARLIGGRENTDQLGGPLRIGALAGKTAETAYENADGGPLDGAGNVLRALLMLAGFLSVSIGLINLLPIPILDGGHLVYYAYEAVAGRPLGEGAQEWGFRVGLALVLGLMVFTFWNDLRYLGVFESLGALLS